MKSHENLEFYNILGSDTFVGLPTFTFTIIYVYGLSIFKRKSFFMREVTKRMNYLIKIRFHLDFESLENETVFK